VQSSQLTGWAMQHGRMLEAIIMEPGVSGGVPFNERPGGAWADLRKGDVLVAAKLVRLFLTIVSAFAEFERDRIGERIRQAKAKQRLDGQYSGGIRRMVLPQCSMPSQTCWRRPAIPLGT
jgi:hypothetical protein